MSGIVGYIGGQNAIPILIDVLRRLEYRGYDSTGIAVIHDSSLAVRKRAGNIENLKESLRNEPLSGSIGIGHTRWATHGKPTENNAHPHITGRIAIVHNGIMENYLTLKESLIKEGRSFISETDTEVIAHLIDKNFEGNLEQAVQKAVREIVGPYALAVISHYDPEKIVIARNENPIVIGLGKGEFYVASDTTAILSYVKDIIFLDDGEVAVIKKEGVQIYDSNGKLTVKNIRRLGLNPILMEKGGYRHFILKEIFEQPRAIWDTVRGRISGGDIIFEDFRLGDSEIKKVNKIFITACGTSWHAGLIGKFMIENLSRIPVEVDISSECRYRNPIMDSETLLIAISESGETVDTITSLREGKRRGAKTISICNTIESSISRESDITINVNAGPEISVASTKTFTSSLSALYLLAVYLAKVRGAINQNKVTEKVQGVLDLIGKVEDVMSLEEEIEGLSRIFYERKGFLYLGRGINYPVALEGAMKMKELSYIYAEGYPGGEMKHGPIALIDENTPVVILAPKTSLYEKNLIDIEEVKARQGVVIVFATEGDTEVRKMASHVLYLPHVTELLTPILFTIPLQFLAYYVALRRGLNVDRPRNLAKSVTVE
ncbi:MAG: glutamine--fructose-6-phosphate aminotransferase [Nitrospinae bacterium RIFCSPLOWO2_02_FULL_39_110]|nr:MAG: glutamine--fructose-6-phosphate aminotransferase [Nitrospinae bacterium RIFCSPHIGHO2_02_FULL_39_82]OGW00354.1 MAG: glutamine--fructose-6-phosphate aminotransferase [Nitrospinae bacterium RIFCSPHIGHO2_12_FULL_39_42]OGW03846.1 MAG: glutamine--fructose-6-phosphate aminotransferase [Nitrospinae bacterium RIFCSPLOWO2_02_FULL_39_110]OGW05199.1 MAG: glutamine--fructose-6-phosphate aminotransferase [Nitrospinae bacterium RIFCSPLOWO2_02_39_17]OGW08006.1 MAG: glutamine--fructose-6-phosphate amino